MATKAQSADGPTTSDSAVDSGEGVRRRDFLNVAAVSFARVGAVAAIAPLLVLGVASSRFGVSNVLIASPLVLLAVAVVLVQVSFAFSGRSPVPRIDVLSTYWTESHEAVREPGARASGGERPPGAEAEGDHEHQGA